VIDPRHGVADDDPFGPDEYLFDDAAQHLLAGFDGGGVGSFAESGKESVEILRELEVGLPVEELGLEGVEVCRRRRRRCQARAVHN